MMKGFLDYLTSSSADAKVQDFPPCKIILYNYISLHGNLSYSYKDYNGSFRLSF